MESKRKGHLAEEMRPFHRPILKLRSLAAGRRRRETALRTLALMARELAGTRDLAQATDVVVSTVCRLFRPRQSFLYQLDQTTGSLICVAGAGKGDLARWIGQTLGPGEGVVGRAVEKGRPIWFSDALTDPRIRAPEWLRALLLEEGDRSLVGVPLIAREKTLGALLLTDRAGRVFTEGDLQLLSAFADQAGMAIDYVRLNAETRRAPDDLGAAQEELLRRETFRATGELAAGIAHHLNNLLTVILGEIQLLLADVQTPAIRRALKTVERATLDGAEVVRGVYEFSRMQPQSEMAELDLNELAEGALELTRSFWQAQARGTEVGAALERGEIPVVRGDPPSLREVLMNLLLNAGEALRDPGMIVVKTWASGPWVYCSVIDPGMGMSEEVRRRALEPFFTTKGPKRTGLGLSIAYGIVRRHQGELAIESAERDGTTVTLRLPAASDGSEAGSGEPLVERGAR